MKDLIDSVLLAKTHLLAGGWVADARRLERVAELLGELKRLEPLVIRNPVLANEIGRPGNPHGLILSEDC